MSRHARASRSDADLAADPSRLKSLVEAGIPTPESDTGGRVSHQPGVLGQGQNPPLYEEGPLVKGCVRPADQRRDV
jgi:hypothetical protein